MRKMVFGDLLLEKDGLIKGPFGGDIKKSLFVPKSNDTYKVYEQGVVLNRDINRGDYYLSKEYVEKKLKRFIVKENDILLTGAGTLGELFIVPPNAPKGVINQALLRVRLNKNIVDQNYFCYYFKYYVKSIISNINGDSVIPNLPPLPIIKSTEIDIPEISTQQKIAAVLSALDAKIELNQRINAELESMAKTLYDYWFVQFEFPTPLSFGHPPKYDIKSLDNNKNKTVVFGGTEGGYKSTGGKMVWNEKLGKNIPEGWKVESLGKALKTHLGGTPSTKNPEYWENASIPWLNSGDLSNFPIISSSSFVTKKGVDNSATTILPKGSVVISLVRYIRPSIITLEACANQSVVGILESEELKNTFIYPWLVNEVPRLMSLRTGAQQPHINKETIDETLLCIPPENILNQYYKISEPIYKKIINLAFESQTLTELRDWLLPMLMNGQVKV